MDASALDRIKRSPTYGNLLSAMDTVFGSGGWSIAELWPDEVAEAEDFSMRVDIGQIRGAAYLSVGDTHMTGRYAAGPYGHVGISVPDPDVPTYYPDGIHTGNLLDYCGSAEERKKFGPSGEDLPGIIAYLELLKRYLDERPPADAELLERIKQSATYKLLTSKMDLAFGSDWSVNELWPSGVADDFRMKVDIDGIQGAAYLSVRNTDTIDRRPTSPYGLVGVSVPDPGAPYVFPDGEHADSVLEYCGTSEERGKYRQGALGDETFLFLRILQQYLLNHESAGQHAQIQERTEEKPQQRTANGVTRAVSASSPMYRQCPQCGAEIGLRERCPSCGYSAPVRAVTHPHSTRCPATVWCVALILTMWGIFQVWAAWEISSQIMEYNRHTQELAELSTRYLKTVAVVVGAGGLALAILLVCRVRVARVITLALCGANILLTIVNAFIVTNNAGPRLLFALLMNGLYLVIFVRCLYGDQAREFFYKPPATQQVRPAPQTELRTQS